MKEKKTYRIRNWSEYNRALVNRGSVTLWIDEASVQGWLTGELSGGRGASCFYGAAAIECALMVQSVFHLPLRATQGFLESVFELMGLALPVPDSSTLSRRRVSLQVSLQRLSRHMKCLSAEEGVHLVVDGTGLKIYGEGEWKVKKHGVGKRRRWLSVSLGIDALNGEIVACRSGHNVHSDKPALPHLLNEAAQVAGPVLSVRGDGAYDAGSCYASLAEHGARALIPPMRRAQLRKEAVYAARNANVQRIRELKKHLAGSGTAQERLSAARQAWKEEVGYHKRSRVETSMMQMKTIFGAGVSARGEKAQAVEVRVRCKALNRMMSLGRPHSQAA